MEEALAALRDAAAGEDGERIRQRIEALSQAVSRFGEAIARTVREQPSGAPSGSSGGGDRVVDAEFEDVDDGRRKHG